MSVFHSSLQALEERLSSINLHIGHSVAWLTAIMVVLTTAIVVARTFFNINHGGVQESLTYMHATIIMLASAYTLRKGGHIRVDIFYRRFNNLQRAWVDALGAALLLLPMALFIFFISWEFVVSSWQTREGSPDPSGIPAVFLLKTLLLASGVLLTAQALAELAGSLVILTFKNRDQEKS